MSGKWFSGPPPSCGWWIARVMGLRARIHADGELLGWWDGTNWSEFAHKKSSAASAAACALSRGGHEANEIEWQARPKSWPERSKT